MEGKLFAHAGIHLIAALAILFFFLHLYRSYRKSYLLRWIGAWCGYVGLTTINLSSSLSPSGSRAGLLLSLLGLWFSIVLAAGLAWGALELAQLRPLKLQDARTVFFIILTFTFGLTLILAVVPADVRRTGVHLLSALVLAAASGCGAVLVWYQRARGKSTPFLLFSLVLMSYAAFQVFSLVTTLTGTLTVRSAVDLVFQTVLALGILISLLEDEREAAMQAASQVEHLAYHDQLTGLPNRSLFFDRLMVALSHATRHRYKAAVLFLDLDNFKLINDSLGHTTGDSLLKLAAERIRGCVREEDTVARFGGDEFIILIHIIGRVEDAGKIAQKLLQSMSQSFNVGGREIVVTSSLGISIFPHDGSDVESLVKNADTAMYRAKEQGRDSYQFYAPTMNSRALEMLELETGLRRALQRNEFVLHYQPLVDLEAGTVFGFEALLRWQHPDLGLLPPDRFIATAESTGLIITIGDWVLREACRQARIWQRQRGQELIMSVNLSARQFQQADLTERVRSALEQADLRPRFLELEITESSAMSDVNKTIRILRELKQLGVRISIDDFGTGYSSLSYLKQFPVDTLKLDQSFVQEITVPEDGAIARGVIAMAHSLKLKVMAEGVETLGQLDFLKSSSCDRLQGFLFSRPLAPEGIEKFLLHNGRMIPVGAGH